MRRRGASLLALMGIALLLAGVAAADKEQRKLTAAGQAAARAAVLKRSDLGSAAGWKGGAAKPAAQSGTGCPGFDPKQSDLVLIGEAESVWKNVGVQLDSVAQVLQSPRMVQLDWQRTVLSPQVEPCLRSKVAKETGTSARFVSMRRLAFPAVGKYVRAYRILLDVNSPPTSSTTVRVLVDLVLIGDGRTEITLTTTATFVASTVVLGAEHRLARILVARARA